MRNDIWVGDRMTDAGVVSNGMVEIHPKRKCVHSTSPCLFHSPTEHAMRGLDLVYLIDSGLFMRRCPHGRLHPDPDGHRYALVYDAGGDEDLLPEAYRQHVCCCRKECSVPGGRRPLLPRH